MTRSASTRRARRWPSLLVALCTAVGLVALHPGPAGATPPQGAFLNPDDDGPGNMISDKQDADGTFHFVLRASDPDGGQSVSSVQIQIEDGDLDATFET